MEAVRESTTGLLSKNASFCLIVRGHSLSPPRSLLLVVSISYTSEDRIQTRRFRKPLAFALEAAMKRSSSALMSARAFALAGAEHQGQQRQDDRAADKARGNVFIITSLFQLSDLRDFRTAARDCLTLGDPWHRSTNALTGPSWSLFGGSGRSRIAPTSSNSLPPTYRIM
jgi:hypothetical protein